MVVYNKYTMQSSHAVGTFQINIRHKSIDIDQKTVYEELELNDVIIVEESGEYAIKRQITTTKKIKGKIYTKHHFVFLERGNIKHGSITMKHFKSVQNENPILA